MNLHIAWLLPLLALAVALPAAAGTSLYVSPAGRDTWSGRLKAPDRARTDGPFASLERARDEIRRLKQEGGLPAGGVTVWVRGGDYEVSAPLALTAQDSGEWGKSVTWRACEGEQVRLLGGRLVTGWQPVTDRAVLDRLDPAARGKVRQANLRALGITDFGGVESGGLELFFAGRRMTLARWPNEGFTKIVDTVGGEPYDIRGTWGDKVGKFTYEGDRPSRWVGEKDPWAHGYWFWDWSDQRQAIASVDPEKKVISLKPPYHGYGYRKGQWYYAFNLLSELDQPGEWYLDRETGIIYFWPPSDLRRGRPVVSVLDSLVTMTDVSRVTLRGLILEATRGTAVVMRGGEGNRVVGCTLRNLGASAISVSGGRNHGVVACDIYQTAQGGISLSGGDRPTLTPAGHYADNNHIHHYSEVNRMYHPAISLQGVGNRATHNLIHDTPHMAIMFGGNDHAIEYNEIHHVCLESNDAGAIYAGRDWTMRGTIIRYNYLHEIQGFENRGCVGVYLDDMFCGTEISSNLFYRVCMAAFIGGGRDVTITNNLFVDCNPSVHIDARALGWAADTVPTTMMERLQAMPYQDALWRSRYPALAGITGDDPAAPRGNLVARNVSVGGRWINTEDKAKPLVRFEDNLIDQKPDFVRQVGDRWVLPDDSPAYRMGFVPIPLAKIGLYPDSRRPAQSKER